MCRKLNAALGLGEAGELQGVVKKEMFYGKLDVKQDVLSEAGDLLFYLTWLVDEYGLTLEQVIDYNIDKLSGRYKGPLTHHEFSVKEKRTVSDYNVASGNID